MTPPPKGRREAEPDGPTIDRRTVLSTIGLLGAAVGSGCVAGIPDGRRREDRIRSPSNVVKPSFARTVRGGDYRLSFRWRALDRHWGVHLAVTGPRYRSAKRADRSIPGCYDDAVASPISGRVAVKLFRALEAAGIDSPLQQLHVATRFVRSLEYVRDEAATGELEYPKYVVETLVEGSGDCEDAATLLAGVLSASPFDHRTALVFFPGHVGVGVWPGSIGEAVGPLRSIGGREYLYLDPTKDVPLGIVPDEYVESGEIAIYDGRWRGVDIGALTEHTRATFQRGGPMDPRDYL